MPGLLDIAPSSLTVPVRGTSIPITGVSATGFAVLLQRFPVFRELLTGREPKLDAETIFKLAPEAIAAIIAAGTGMPGSVEVEAVAASLAAHEQLELIQKIIEATMPKGVAPFVEALTAIAGVLDAGPTNIPVTKSPQRSKS